MKVFALICWVYHEGFNVYLFSNPLLAKEYFHCLHDECFDEVEIRKILIDQPHAHIDKYELIEKLK